MPEILIKNSTPLSAFPSGGIDFNHPLNIGSEAAPVTGTTTLGTSGYSGVKVTIYHQDTARPAFLDNAIVTPVSGNVYVPNQLNIIDLEYVNSSLVRMSISYTNYEPVKFAFAKIDRLDHYINGLSRQFTTSATSGTGAGNNVLSTTTRLGYLELMTGTDTTGRHSLGTSLSAIAVGIGRIMYFGCTRIPTLSDATDRFYHRVGLVDSSTLAGINNGVFFQYTDNANSGKWELRTRSGGVESTADIGITVVAGTDYVFCLDIISTSLVNIYMAPGTWLTSLPSTVTATLATNIPTGLLGFQNSVQKIAGTTNRTAEMDFTQAIVL